MVARCDECGDEIHIGDWPICKGVKGQHVAVGHLDMGEEPMEPYIDHNVAEHPVLITTRGERRKLMEKGGLEYRPKRTDLLTGRTLYFDQGRR